MNKLIASILLLLILVCGMALQGCTITDEPKIKALRAQIDEVEKQIVLLRPHYEKVSRIRDDNRKMEEQIDRLKAEIRKLKMKKNGGGK